MGLVWESKKTRATESSFKWWSSGLWFVSSMTVSLSLTGTGWWHGGNKLWSKGRLFGKWNGASITTCGVKPAHRRWSAVGAAPLAECTRELFQRHRLCKGALMTPEAPALSGTPGRPYGGGRLEIAEEPFPNLPPHKPTSFLAKNIWKKNLKKI